MVRSSAKPLQPILVSHVASYCAATKKLSLFAKLINWSREALLSLRLCLISQQLDTSRASQPGSLPLNLPRLAHPPRCSWNANTSLIMTSPFRTQGLSWPVGGKFKLISANAWDSRSGFFLFLYLLCLGSLLSLLSPED